MSIHPEIQWAQRSSATEPEKNIIFLSIATPELDPSYELTVSSNKISFKGHSTPPPSTATAMTVAPKDYAFSLELFGEVEEVKRALDGKKLSVVLKKKEVTEEYWPRLTKDKVKLNYVKTDFSKWRDQDEQDGDDDDLDAGMAAGGDPSSMDFASMMQGMPGMGGAGGPGGMGGMGGMDMEAMLAQMKAEGIGAGGEGDDAPEEDEDDEDDGDDAPPALEEATEAA